MKVMLIIVKMSRFLLQSLREAMSSFADNAEQSKDSVLFILYFGIMSLPLFLLYIPLYVIKKLFERLK